MNKIASLKPGDDGVLIEALINHVVSGKTNGAHRSTYLSMTLQDDTGSIDAKLWNASEEQVQTLDRTWADFREGFSSLRRDGERNFPCFFVHGKYN